MKKRIENLSEEIMEECRTEYAINGLIRLMKKYGKSVKEITDARKYFEGLNAEERLEEMRIKWLNEQYNTEII